MGVEDSAGRKDHRSVEVPESDYQPTKQGGDRSPGQRPKRVIEVPDHTYQATRAELNEPVSVDGTFEEAVKRILQPTEVRGVSAADWAEAPQARAVRARER